MLLQVLPVYTDSYGIKEGYATLAKPAIAECPVVYPLALQLQMPRLSKG